VLTREQHLTQIDGLAAAAAHELGTPLSTIFLISRELEQSIEAKGLDEHARGDLRTLREQAQRCREILARSRSCRHRARRSTGCRFRP
jgi:two-component system sensor histidine kinase RegB